MFSKETLAVGLLDAKVFSYANETGLAILNSAKHFFAINSLSTHLLWRIKDQSKEHLQPLTCWTVLASTIKPTQLLLCSRTRFFLGSQEFNNFQPCNFFWARNDGQYLEMKPNNTNSLLLLLHDSRTVQLIDVEDDLQTELQQITLAHSGIRQLLWCGNTAFGIQTESEPEQLSIYGLSAREDNSTSFNGNECGDYFTFSFPTNSQFAVDLDGIRVFSQHLANLIFPVPEPSKAVLGLGSNEPAAMLFEAERKLEQRSHVSYEYVRSINADLMPTAVDHCLAAAAHHFEPKVQKQLLKAASIGMRRCDRPYDSDKFVRICRLLRVLNSLRLMGIPLTFTQLEELTTPSVIDRLVALGHWPMAIKLCEFLGLDPKEGVYRVLAHWCTAMMVAHKQRQGERTATSTEALAQRIIDRLKQYPAISYADIAEMAARQDLPTLANILLDLETNINRQVTVMLKLKQLDKALQQAAQSQQPDLMHLVLKHLRNSMSGRELELLLRKVPQALSIYQSEIRDEAPERLLTLYEQNDDFIRQAIHYLQRAEQMSQDCFDTSRTIEQFSKAEKALRNMRDTGNAQLVAECSQLFAENARREEKYSIPMTHMSVRETFLWAAGNDELALLEQLRKQHRLNEKQVFHWTVEGFAQAGKWQQLEQYVRNTRKSPMGYLPVIELCALHGNKNLGLRLMDRLTGYEEQVRAYLALGEVKKAMTLAAEKIDMQMLQLIRRRFPPTSEHWTEVSKVMEGLAKAAK